MKPLPLLIAAAVAWWLYTRQQRPAPQLPAARPAASSTRYILRAGRRYVVVGEPTADGLVPVQYQPPDGMLAAQVVQLYDPTTGRIDGV